MFSSQNSQVSSDANYIEDVFSTYLYTGTGSALTVTNGIDLAGKGGLVWVKRRDTAVNNFVFDTARGVGNYLITNSTGAQSNLEGVSAFNSNGFSVGTAITTGMNTSGGLYASWTFREQPKFFDVVTYTGNGTTNRQIAHNLGSTPGCILVKRTNVSGSWAVYHRSSTEPLCLNNTNAAGVDFTAASAFGNGTSGVAPTSTVFTVGTDTAVNSSGSTYVAYLFAHNAGGFGLTGTDNVISCGSYTTDASGNATVNLGYEPQFVMYKFANSTSNWVMLDTMRGLNNTNDYYLLANISDAEQNWGAALVKPTATGFTVNSMGGAYNIIYIAIRRGPMKVPTSGTSVFKPQLGRTAGSPNYTSGWPVDFLMNRETAASVWLDVTRLTGYYYLQSNSTAAETAANATTYNLALNTGFGSIATSYGPEAAWMFRRSPNFMDVVCYTGTGVARTVTHNLAAVPELMIVKSRSVTGSNWLVYNSTIGPTNSLYLNLTTASDPNSFVNNTAPTSSVFSLGTSSYANGSGSTYVAYLFATCAGVSKVGSYTGTGTTKQVDCGFTGGARFVLIKRTDSTGDWYVWDTARGIVSGNDPYLLLNSTAAEVTSTDYIDTYSAGFEISSTAPAAINASGGTFIFLAIA